MLDARKAAILCAVVRDHIETGQPVGSIRVARAHLSNVSPATVRNEMFVLEREGYLHQPHTSAGRVPTEKGYRYFVDQISQVDALPALQRQQVKEFFARAHGELEHMLHDTSQLLSNLTDCAGVVVGPPHDRGLVRSVQLVELNDRLALAVVVFSNAVVEKHTIEIGADQDASGLAAASAHLSRHLSGRSLARVGAVPDTGDPSVDAVASAVSSWLRRKHDDDLDTIFVRGASRVAQAFEAVDTVRQVLAALEQQYLIVGLLRQALDRPLSVSIGSELGVAPLAECSLVVAPYRVAGEALGTIGVLGPTRMDYPNAMAAVDLVSQRLGRVLDN